MSSRLLLLILVAQSVMPDCSPAHAADAIAEMIRATFKIANKGSTATGFLIFRPNKSHRAEQDLVLVTAAHVFQKMTGDTCRIVLRERRADGTYQRKEVSLTIRAENKPRWFQHPEADVAALPVELPATAVAALPLDCVAGESTIQAGNLNTGDEVWIPCYPAKLEATVVGFPVLRRGVVASFPLTPVALYKTYLVDVRTFGGDSGAPVMVEQRAATDSPETGRSGPLIVGLVVGQQRQTDRVTMPYGEFTVHHPLGLAIIVQGELIRQTIEFVPQ